jgi:hypothetical protein
MTDQPFPEGDPTRYSTNVPGPVSPTAPAAPASGGREPDSTTEVAKAQVPEVAGGAKDAATKVAGTAKEQAGEVVQETRTQVKQLLGQAGTELSDQAHTQQKRAASGLRSLGDQLGAMAEGSDRPGPATDVAQQVADKAHQLAGWLEARNPQGVLDEVRTFARRKPAVFLVAALGAGVLAGRLTRGLSAGDDATDSSGPSAKNGQQNRIDPGPEQLGNARSPQLTSVPEGSADVPGALDFQVLRPRDRGDLPGVGG